MNPMMTMVEHPVRWCTEAQDLYARRLALLTKFEDVTPANRASLMCEYQEIEHAIQAHRASPCEGCGRGQG